MSDVVLSKGVRSNLLAMQNTAALLDQTQTRLATGRKVNSALDGPTNYFTAASLKNRAGDLGNLLDAISNAMKTLEAADNGIKAITKLVESAQASARQAIQSARSTASTIGNNATALTATTTMASLGFTDGNTVTITSSAGSVVFTATTAATATVENFIDAVNADADVGFKASLSSDGRILLEAVGTASLASIATSGDAADLANLGFTAANSAVAAGTLSTTRSAFASQFSVVIGQITKLAQDASFNGVNLLDNDALTVYFNETSTSSLIIAGVDDSATGLGLSAPGNTFQTDYDVNIALAQIAGALSKLRAQGSTFGSNLSVVQARQNFTKELISTLTTGADNLVLADTNEEGANMLALQTRQQLSSTALSLAAQSDQAVLRLFG